MSPSNVHEVHAESVSGLKVAARRIETAGALAGLAGGLAMALVGALIAAGRGDSIWRTPKQIAAFLFGTSSLSNPGFDLAPVLAGSLLHIALSMVFGVAYAVIISRVLGVTTEYGAPVVGGLVYGLLIWMIAYFVVAPLFNPALLDAYAPSFIIQNLVYGTAVGLAYMALRPATFTFFARPLSRGVPTASAE